MTAFIYRKGTDQIVGAYDGGIGGVGRWVARSGPASPSTSSVVGGTASCLEDLGYALPPGEYDVRAAIDQYDRTSRDGRRMLPRRLRDRP